MDETPVHLIDRQVEAYNAGDIDAFMATYHPDIEIALLPNAPHLVGHAMVQALYLQRFSPIPRPKASILNRIIVDNFITDHERIENFEGGVIEALVTYQVEDGLIRRVWMKRGVQQALQTRP